MPEPQLQPIDGVVRTTLSEIAGEERNDFDQFLLADEDLVFEVVAPELEPGIQLGALIYISPKPSAKLPPGWEAVLEKHRLVWVGAQDSGNEIHVGRRVALALLNMDFVP